MAEATFTTWCKRIDDLASRAGLVEPGASYSRRFGRDEWRDMFDNGLTPEAAWEFHLEPEPDP